MAAGGGSTRDLSELRVSGEAGVVSRSTKLVAGRVRREWMRTWLDDSFGRYCLARLGGNPFFFSP